MEITPLPAGDRQFVQGYGRGGFLVSGHNWVGSVLIFPDRTLAWPVAELAQVDLRSLEALHDADPAVEILLLGTGPRMALPPKGLKAELRALGIGIETMDTGAACRTYNLLLSEERRVAAALLPID